MINTSQKALRGAVKDALLDVLPAMFQEQEKRFDQKIAERFGAQEVRLDQKLAEQFGVHESRFDQKLDDLKMNLRDDIHSTVKASEAGLIRRMDELEGRLTTRMDEGFSTVLDALDREIFPLLNRHEEEILALKLHVKIA